MIDAKHAYEKVVSQYGFPIDPVAYDVGDGFVFDIGGVSNGESVIISGSWPIHVSKNDGSIKLLDFNDGWDFWDRKDTIPRVMMDV